MATCSRARFRVARGGSAGALDRRSKAVSVHGFVGRGPLHRSTVVRVEAVRLAAASCTARMSALAWSESRAGGMGTPISLPAASTHVLHAPAVGSARATGARARPASSPQVTRAATSRRQAKVPAVRRAIGGGGPVPQGKKRGGGGGGLRPLV